MSRLPRSWRQRAEALARAFPPGALHPRVVAWAEAGTAAARRPWCLALSGGADSLALVLLVWAHWPRRRASLRLIHFDHRQRGSAAAGRERRFCRNVAQALGIACITGRWKAAVPGAPEAVLRRARQTFFTEAMAASGARALWLGHQREDIAETLLMRLARGSGTAGLAAPRPVQQVRRGTVHLRPLLTLEKAALQGVMRHLGIPWCEDASNQEHLHLRNRIRSAVVPVWLRAVSDRNALAGAALTRERLEEDDQALEQWLDSLSVLGPGPVLHVSRLAGKPLALWRRALHRWLVLTPYRGDLSRQGFDTLLGASRRLTDTRVSLGAEGFAVLKSGLLRYRRAHAGRRQ